MTKMRRAIVLVVALVLIGFAPSCASPSVAAKARMPAETTLQQLVNIQQRITGTVEDRIAAQRLTYVRLQYPLMQCMSAAGYDYNPPPFFSGYEDGRTGRELTSDDVLAPVDSAAVTRDGFFQQIDTLAGDAELAARAVAVNPGYTNLPETEKAKYNETVDSCTPPGASYQDVADFPEAAKMQAAFNQLLADAEAAPQVTSAMADYPACMESAGFKGIASRSDIVDDVTLAFINKDPAAFHPGTDAWDSAVALESSAATADAACRTDGYSAALGVLGGTVGAFAAAHESSLRVIDSEWASLVSDDAAASSQFDQLVNHVPALAAGG